MILKISKNGFTNAYFNLKLVWAKSKNERSNKRMVLLIYFKLISK